MPVYYQADDGDRIRSHALDNYEEARAEAERLSLKYPGNRVDVIRYSHAILTAYKNGKVEAAYSPALTAAPAQRSATDIPVIDMADPASRLALTIDPTLPEAEKTEVERAQTGKPPGDY